ncbi:hypothetical protein EDD21DRAFT_427170 [Dissophora ornata]|nr:hypothetical protein BGZ58_010948 [Dissophora ornata]KAI8606711.1 hypothetical protein EDD21DRAFT_427170 [Dissophora ornata]
MKFSSLALIAAIAAPVLAAKTWDVNIVNGTFSPQELTIAPGDSVSWILSDGADHAIVETTPGNRTCNSLAGGFNSGTKTNGTTYQRTFPNATIVNYKDGVGANCLKGATGTITAKDQSGSSGNLTSTSTSTSPATSTNSATHTAAPISSPTHSSASGFMTPEKSVLLGVVCFIGALAL